MYIETNENLKSLIEYKTGNIPFARFVDKPGKYRDLLSNLHWHNEVQIIYVKYGQIRCNFRSGEEIADEGEAIFINSGLIHRFESMKDCEIFSVIFNLEFIAPQETVIFEKYVRPIQGSMLEYRIFRKNKEQDAGFLKQIRELCDIEDIENNALEIQLRTGKFWLDLYNEVKDELSPRILKSNKVSVSRLRTMIYYIMQNYSTKIALQDLAQAAKVSKSEVLRCFRAGLETSPVKFLTEYRVSRACDLLKTTDKSITEIAEMTGFDNSGYFCKVFKKIKNISPKDYRKRRPQPSASS